MDDENSEIDACVKEEHCAPLSLQWYTGYISEDARRIWHIFGDKTPFSYKGKEFNAESIHQQLSFLKVHFAQVPGVNPKVIFCPSWNWDVMHIMTMQLAVALLTPSSMRPSAQEHVILNLLAGKKFHTRL